MASKDQFVLLLHYGIAIKSGTLKQVVNVVMSVEVSQVGVCRRGLLLLSAKKVLSTMPAIPHQVKLILTLRLSLIWLIIQALIASIVYHFTKFY